MAMLTALCLGLYKGRMMPQQIKVTLIPTALLSNSRMDFPAYISLNSVKTCCGVAYKSHVC